MVLQAWASLGPQVTAVVPRLHDGAVRAGGGVRTAPRRRRRHRGDRPGRLAAARDDGWTAVAVTSVDLDDSETRAGTTRTVTVTVELGELTVDDLRVEAVHGLLGHDGEFREPVEIARLQPAGGGVFTGEIAIGVAGSYGVSACAFPVHRDLASPFDIGRVAWAE